MVDSIEAQTTWQEKHRCFEEFENYQGWEYIKGLCALTAQIRDSPYACLVYASTSHADLVISCYEKYTERIENDAIIVSPYKNAVTIRYCTKLNRTLEKTVCSYDEAWKNTVRMIERLLNSQDNIAPN